MTLAAVQPTARELPAREKVTVIIPSRASEGTLERCLEGLMSQRTRATFDAIVVHSGPEPVSERVMSRFPEVTFAFRPDSELPGTKRNWALRRTNARWVAFLDSDCVASPGWLEALLTMAASADVAGVGGGVEIARPRRIRSWAMHVLEFGEWLPTGGARPCDDFPTCNAVYERAALLDVGGFADGIFPCEDTLLNHRLRHHGHTLLFDPSAIVFHIHTRSTRQVLRHNYEFGVMYGAVSVRFGLRGYRLAGSRACIAPVVAARLLTACRRVGRYGRGAEPLYLAVTAPFMLVCLLAWGIGFARGGRIALPSRSAAGAPNARLP